MAVTTSKITASYEDPDNPGQTGPVADLAEIGGATAALAAKAEASSLRRLDQLTEDISLHPHTGWQDSTTIALTVQPIATFSVDPTAVVGYTYQNAVTVAEAGTYIIILRLPVGTAVNTARIARTGGASTDPLHGVFHGGAVTQGGFSYVFMAGSIDLAASEVLTAQEVGTEYTTEYGGTVTRLDEHEALPHAHQDSPQRVEHLGLSAPAGRQVYLTVAARHPATEHIFSVPLSGLGNRNTGASVVDLSGVTVGGTAGPTAASDVSSYPGVFNAARLAAVWHHLVEPSIRLAVLASIGTPTQLHITGGGVDHRFDLEANGGTPTVGGRQYRLMRTIPLPGLATLRVLEDLHLNRDRPLVFSLAYGTSFLTATGTLDAGTTQPVGYHESQGGGVWRPRARGVIEELVAVLATATDDQKFALASALHAVPEVLYTDATAVTPDDQAWRNLTLSRALTAADDNRLLTFRFWNAEVEAEVYCPVRRWRTITPQNPNGRAVRERAVALVVHSGDADNVDEGRASALLLGRPINQGTDRILIGSQAFGDAAQNSWKAHQLEISLRSLI